MIKKSLAGVLILALGFVLCVPAQAQAPDILAPGAHLGPSSGEIAGVIVGVVAAVVVVTILVVHHSKKRAVTGCVNSGPDGMTVTDEGDKRVYTLSGDTAGVKVGERVRLQGKRIKAGAGKQPIWDTRKIGKDFGACQP